MGSHSAMTAEGDNSVLMQKVVKDILTDSRKKRHDNVQISKKRLQEIKQSQNLSNEMMRDLVYLRETVEIQNIV